MAPSVYIAGVGGDSVSPILSLFTLVRLRTHGSVSFYIPSSLIECYPHSLCNYQIALLIPHCGQHAITFAAMPRHLVYKPALNTETADLLSSLKELVGKQHDEALFACGGSIAILDPDNTTAPATSKDSTDDGLLASAPVTIRWDPSSANVLSKDTKLVFPLEPGHGQSLARLVDEADPATFGLHGKDVLDESYRKASKLDPSQFSTSFNPYDLGIVDTVAQALLPSTKAADSHRAVRAELYKLNVSS